VSDADKQANAARKKQAQRDKNKLNKSMKKIKAKIERLPDQVYHRRYAFVFLHQTLTARLTGCSRDAPDSVQTERAPEGLHRSSLGQ
jgi:hypothetical protein